jgi:hypothetical protein
MAKFFGFFIVKLQLMPHLPHFRYILKYFRQERRPELVSDHQRHW